MLGFDVVHRLGLPLALLLIVAPSCDDAAEETKNDKSNETAAKTEKDSSDGPTKKAEPAAREDGGKTDKKNEDKGAASVKIGDVTWTAERANARLRDKRLSISASRMEMSKSDAKRQQVSLVIADYDGPGDYKAAMGSSFVGVGIDIEKAKDAAESDSKTAAVAKQSMQNADVIMLHGADIHVTSAGDEFIDGTFEWKAPPGMKDPSLTDGTFHALVKE
jgi:hypothetical protein